MISQIGINYRPYSLSSHEGDAGFELKAGDRMPYFVVDGKSFFDQLRSPKFHLVSFSDGENEPLDNVEELSAFAFCDHQTVPLYPHISELFGVNNSFNILLRPDNHIALISGQATIQPFVSYLRNLLNS